MHMILADASGRGTFLDVPHRRSVFGGARSVVRLQASMAGTATGSASAAVTAADAPRRGHRGRWPGPGRPGRDVVKERVGAEAWLAATPEAAPAGGGVARELFGCGLDDGDLDVAHRLPPGPVALLVAAQRHAAPQCEQRVRDPAQHHDDDSRARVLLDPGVVVLLEGDIEGRAHAIPEARNRAFRVLGPEPVSLVDALERARTSFHRSNPVGAAYLPFLVARDSRAFRGPAFNQMADAAAFVRYFERVEEGAADPDTARLLGSASRRLRRGSRRDESARSRRPASTPGQGRLQKVTRERSA